MRSPGWSTETYQLSPKGEHAHDRVGRMEDGRKEEDHIEYLEALSNSTQRTVRAAIRRATKDLK